MVSSFQHTKEVKAKIGSASKERWQDPEYKARASGNMGKSCLSGCTCGRHNRTCPVGCVCGKHKSPNKGKPSALKGRKLSKEAISNQVSSRKKGKGYYVSQEQREKLRVINLGKKHSAATKQKIANSHLGKKYNVTIVGRRAMQESVARTVKLQQQKKPSSLEVAIQRELDILGLNYLSQETLEDCYTVDFYLPDSRMILECDGAYWHNTPVARIKDRNRDAWLSRRGYTTRRILEKEIKENPRTALLFALKCGDA